MEAVAGGSRTEARAWFLQRRLDLRALSTWLLALTIIFYLAFNSGGYALTAHAQVGIAVWWIVTVCAAWRLLPGVRLTRSAVALIGLFGGFTAWTALGITWSISSGRSFEDLALVSCYLGILVLGIAIHRERGAAVRHTLGAVATAIVVVAAVAAASRLWPHLFSGSQTAAAMPNGANTIHARLSWPLNYWNALAALMAIGLPLLLGLATSARTLRAQAAACAGIPILALCGALTQSRGGVIAGAVAAVVFLALSSDRITKLATCIVAAGGSAALVAGALHRTAIRQGLTTGAEHHQATVLLVATLLVCAGVALAQVGVGLLGRHGTLPRLLRPSVPQARMLLAAGVLVVIGVALAAHAPHRLHHAWDDFKTPANSTAGATHFSATSGEGRYQFWVAGVDSAKAHPLTGSGPGTFQLDWLPRAPIRSYVTNAHSLYVETYTEIGLVGLALLVAFFVTALVLLIRQVVRASGGERTYAAAVTAALVAFLVGASFDWLWQMPVVPAALLLLLGACVVPTHRAGRAVGVSVGRSAPRWPMHVGLVVVGLACLLGIAYPLAASSDITRSQNAIAAKDPAAALTAARNAVKLEPDAAATQLQLALVLESQKRYGAAAAAARHAVRDEPQGWTNWLALSSVDAESGDAKGALYAYRRAKAMNPESRLFRS